jgi:succinate dehydrogenase/fumarate reductase cytochrome b subunit
LASWLKAEPMKMIQIKIMPGSFFMVIILVGIVYSFKLFNYFNNIRELVMDKSSLDYPFI